MPKLTSLSVLKILCYRFANEFLALAIASKNPKMSLKLTQSGCDLAQSVKLRV